MNTRISTLLLVAVTASAAGCTFRNRGFGANDSNGGLGGQGVDAGCNPNGGPDSCAADGLACTPILPTTGFTCQLPAAFFACDPSVGCAGDLQCLGGECLQSCTTTADCGDPLTVCSAFQTGGPQQQSQDAGTFCLLDSCGSADAGGFWQPCDDAGGTCVFLSNGFAGPQGACLQGGSVAAGGDCQYYRGADAGLCAPGLICTVDAAGDNAGICLPVCDPFADGGPSCGSGTACVESSIPAAPPAISFYDYYNHSGVCAQGCVPADGGAADSGDPADAGDPDAGAVDGGVSDAGALDGGDAGLLDGGTVDAGVADAGGPAPDAGATDAGGTVNNAACAAPTSCTNASVTSSPTFVCLP